MASFLSMLSDDDISQIDFKEQVLEILDSGNGAEEIQIESASDELYYEIRTRSLDKQLILDLDVFVQLTEENPILCTNGASGQASEEEFSYGVLDIGRRIPPETTYIRSWVRGGIAVESEFYCDFEDAILLKLE